MEVAAARHEVSYAGMCGRGHPVGVQWKVGTGRHPIAMRQTGRQWVQSIGGAYSLFEIAHHAFTSVSDPHDRLEVAHALHAVHYQGMSGELNFSSSQPAPGVAITPLAGVQWKATTGGSKFPFEMLVVDNTTNPAAHVGAHLVPTNPV
jgi:branched-chain amino acid transport system substrate-binding protein